MLMRVFLFFGKPLGASQENEPSPSRSHYGKTKYGDKIAPCGRKKYIPQKGNRLVPALNRFILVLKRMCDAPAIFFAFRRYFELYFVFLMSSGRLV
jgi:hypothetical protein